MSLEEISLDILRSNLRKIQKLSHSSQSERLLTEILITVDMAYMQAFDLLGDDLHPLIVALNKASKQTDITKIGKIMRKFVL